MGLIQRYKSWRKKSSTDTVLVLTIGDALVIDTAGTIVLIHTKLTILTFWSTKINQQKTKVDPPPPPDIQVGERKVSAAPLNQTLIYHVTTSVWCIASPFLAGSGLLKFLRLRLSADFVLVIQPQMLDFKAVKV